MLIFFYLYLMLIVTVICANNCGPCTCFESGYGYMASCTKIQSETSKTLTTIPLIATNYVISVINLSFQPISTLTPNVFMNANLENLKKINMAVCQLTKIDKNSLKKLVKLEAFNCAQNNISEVQVGTFDDNINLIEINLNTNNIRELKNGLFDNLKKLRNLNLDHNKINNIGNKLLIYNENLQMLKLSHNQLKYLDGNIFTKQLQPNLRIFINNNPWECNCKLWNFYKITSKYINNQSYPKCENLRLTRSKNWATLKETDFTCRGNISFSKIESSNYYILICEVEANPGPNSLEWYNIENNEKQWIPSMSKKSERPFIYIRAINITKKSTTEQYICIAEYKKTKEIDIKNITMDEILTLNEQNMKSSEENEFSSEEFELEQRFDVINNKTEYLKSYIGENITLFCKTPQPDNVKWYFRDFLIDGNVIRESNYKFKISTNESESSDLTIRNISEADSGRFTCKISETNNIFFYLQVPPEQSNQDNEINSNSSPVVPIVLATIFVILLVGLIILVFYIRKQKLKQKETNAYEIVDSNKENQYIVNKNGVMVDSTIYISSDNNIYEDIK